MTSELRVTTLSDATGNGPASLTKQSAAKVFGQVSQTTGAADLKQSLNVSSVADIATGIFKPTYSNAFSEAITNCILCTTGGGAGDNIPRMSGPAGDFEPTTLAFEYSTCKGSDHTPQDKGFNGFAIHGDLA